MQRELFRNDENRSDKPRQSKKKSIIDIRVNNKTNKSIQLDFTSLNDFIIHMYLRDLIRPSDRSPIKIDLDVELSK